MLVLLSVLADSHAALAVLRRMLEGALLPDVPC